jgi:RecA-family ATPase
MGKALIYAPAKSGKSWLCLQISQAIGSGQEILGLRTTQGTVLYVQFELGEGILQQRMLETKANYDNVFVGTTFAMKLDTKPGQAMLSKVMEQIEPNVLILDPKYKAIMGDENEATEMRPICDFLDTLIEQYQCSILLIDHAGKDITKHSRGSSIWEDWVDSYIQMKQTSKRGEQLKVEIEPIFLRHSAPPDQPIVAELGTDFQFHLMESNSSVRDAICDWLRSAEEPVSVPEMVKASLGSASQLYKELKGLVEDGLIAKEGKRYSWIEPEES